MRWRTRARFGRAGRSRGAVLVEAAVAMPVIMLVTFGAIEFGLIFTSQSTTSASTNSGARIASTVIPTAASANAAFDTVRDVVADDLGSLVGQADPQLLWIYRADVDGAPIGDPGFQSCAIDCRRFTWDGAAFVVDGGTWIDPDACLFDSDGVDTVGVYVEVVHRPLTDAVVSTVDLSEHSLARLEPVPSEDC